MTQKITTKPDDPEQSKRFIETAKEIGADESADAFERAFKKAVSGGTPDRPKPRG